MRILILVLLVSPFIIYAQLPSKGMFSLGVRTTHNSFSHDGNGLGAGGHFRIQLSDRINTEWFADYISVGDEQVRSNYAHIGWSVLFYPFKNFQYPKLFQPFVSAGHCFDYNKKIAVQNPNVSRDRWGSAVQAGIGTHLYLSERFDITLSSLYMIHLTPEIDAHTHVVDGTPVIQFSEHSHSGLEGHLLTTLSINYKIGQLWGRK